VKNALQYPKTQTLLSVPLRPLRLSGENLRLNCGF
jgi:hypothetical protein